MASHTIPVLRHTKDPKNDPLWCQIFGHISHSDYGRSVFTRPNGDPVNLYNIYKDQTCFLIGRGPSLGKYLENKEIMSLLMNPSIVKYSMNDGPECLNYNCQLYTCTDRPTKFAKRIWKNPNIMKLIAENRVLYHKDNSKNKNIAYDNVYVSSCPNIYSVFTYLIDNRDSKKINFVNSYFSSPAVLYGYHNGIKSTFLSVLKISLLLGFKKIVLIGIDLEMKQDNPYYGKGPKSYPKFHIDHNNKLYDFITPLLENIVNRLRDKNCNYNSQIVTAKEIKALPCIPVIDLKKELKSALK
jgi:hypothetical protein